MRDDNGARLTTEIAAALLATGRTMAALEAATGYSWVRDTFAGLPTQPDPGWKAAEERDHPAAAARLDAVALAAIAQRTYYSVIRSSAQSWHGGPRRRSTDHIETSWLST